MVAEPFKDVRLHWGRGRNIPLQLSISHLLCTWQSVPLLPPWPSDIVWSEQTRLECSDSGECFFKFVCYDPSGPFKKSQVFSALRHASWRSESSWNGKMDPSSDWGICGHSPLDATKGKRYDWYYGAAYLKNIHVPCLSLSLSFQSKSYDITVL